MPTLENVICLGDQTAYTHINEKSQFLFINWEAKCIDTFYPEYPLENIQLQIGT